MFNSIRTAFNVNTNLMADLQQAFADEVKAERQAINEAWNALTNREQKETLEYIRDLAICGRGSDHIFYPKYLELN